MKNNTRTQRIDSPECVFTIKPVVSSSISIYPSPCRLGARERGHKTHNRVNMVICHTCSRHTHSQGKRASYIVQLMHFSCVCAFSYERMRVRLGNKMRGGVRGVHTQLAHARMNALAENQHVRKCMQIMNSIIPLACTTSMGLMHIVRACAAA